VPLKIPHAKEYDQININIYILGPERARENQREPERTRENQREPKVSKENQKYPKKAIK